MKEFSKASPLETEIDNKISIMYLMTLANGDFLNMKDIFKRRFYPEAEGNAINESTETQTDQYEK